MEQTSPDILIGIGKIRVERMITWSLQSVRLPNRNWPLRITLNLPDWVGKVRGGRYLSTGSSRATLVYIRVGYLSSMESPSSSPMRRLNPSALAFRTAAVFRFCFPAGKKSHL